ncbi:LUD domain-containing protein [Natrinema salsiterrestre]|uniref:LUD domain-containing protein n=1 Tax=Natrinema salsiterrestre TaxID=2950540 RepID=A0A9Q4Q2N2_9EURY|nr:LUD domain-containing protein [Natrinema salsiterrestre]MDF9745112.1 LUD domain-containing protein [Natrinema salsiterrestre]
MTVDTLCRFERALEGLEVGFERVAAAEASERIETIVEEPTVGASLPFEGVSLPDDVTTEPTTAELEAARTGVTPVSFAIAEYGTVAVESTADGAEPISLYPDRHVAVVAESDVVPDLSAGFTRLAEGFDAGRDSVVFATGRSATADMGDLVHGVHGPGDVDVIVLEDR